MIYLLHEKCKDEMQHHKIFGDLFDVVTEGSQSETSIPRTCDYCEETVETGEPHCIVGLKGWLKK